MKINNLRINEYQITGGTAHSQPVNVVLRRMPQRNGPDKWSISEHGMCLNRLGRWEPEPIPSSRDEGFLKRCRFDSPEEALEIWKKKSGVSRFIR